MDKELLEFLKEFKNDVNKQFKEFKNDVNEQFKEFKNDVNDQFKQVNVRLDKMDNRLENVENRLENVESRLENVENRLENVENKTDKNTILLEDLKVDIKTIAEVQDSFREQLERAKNKDGKTLGDRLDIIELAVSDTSLRIKEFQQGIVDIKGEIKDLNKNLTNVEIITSSNWNDIAKLKAVK